MNNKKINRKAFLSLISFFFIILVIVVATCFQAGINPSNWYTTKFISNMLITVAICIFGVISGQGMADNYYRTNTSGLFVNTYNKYNDERDKINPFIDKFTEWNEQLYKKEYYQKCVHFLKNQNGIKQAEDVLKLDRTDLPKLLQPCMIVIDDKEVYFKSLTQEQIDSVYLVLSGKIKLQFIHESYFLNAYSRNKKKSMYEQASEQEKAKKTKFTGLMIYRIMLTLIIGLLFAGLTADELAGGSKAQMVIDLVSRLFTLFSALTWGFFIANEMVKDDCIFMDYKTRTLETFYLDVEVNKTFVCEDIQAKAKREYELMKGMNNDEHQEYRN